MEITLLQFHRDRFSMAAEETKCDIRRHWLSPNRMIAYNPKREQLHDKKDFTTTSRLASFTGLFRTEDDVTSRLSHISYDGLGLSDIAFAYSCTLNNVDRIRSFYAIRANKPNIR